MHIYRYNIQVRRPTYYACSTYYTSRSDEYIDMYIYIDMCNFFLIPVSAPRVTSARLMGLFHIQLFTCSCFL